MSDQQAISNYLVNIQRELERREAREHAHRPALKTLLEASEGIHAVNDPARTDAGAPDFIVLRAGTPVGFVETKDIGADLSRIERGEQMRRYLAALPNLVLTDYVEFRWYVSGQLRATARLGDVQDGKLKRSRDGADNLARLLANFSTQVTPTVRTARELALRMGDMAREIRRLIEHSVTGDEPSRDLLDQMKAFSETLIPGLSPDQFADMYAQTVAYGLFAARIRHQGPGRTQIFRRRDAYWDLPPTNPFLRELFQQVAGGDLDSRVAWMVDVLVDLLAHADTDEILRDFGRRKRQEDPIIHFYETFLSEYDPQMREQRGVYYTPEPVVSYIVRSVDGLLRRRFKRGLGLAAPETLILDPAVGTGTFLYFVIQHIYDMLWQQRQLGSWDVYVRDHLLPRIFGFELLMAPYAVAHMKLGFQLQETGYKFDSNQRLGIYLTNTLEEAVQHPPLPFAGFISREANEAAAVKRDRPIMVVLGNPPYSGHSANRGAWIDGLLRGQLPDGTRVPGYYDVDGEPLGERNTKWLQDDYVKFIRFGQWRIQQTGSGVLAFITNNGYLDNPTFRGMRRSLMNAFTDIYILNLHGSSMKGEAAPDGSKDENVFDIQTGVAIGIFVKGADSGLKSTGSSETDSPVKRTAAHIHYADVWGRRESKYTFLAEHDLSSTEWTEFEPQPPFYLFVPQDTDRLEEYNHGWKLTDIFPVNVMGFQTHRDHFAVDFDREVIVQRIQELRDTRLSDSEIRSRYELTDNRDWQLTKARAQLRARDNWAEDIIDCLYRPFDWRPCYFSDIVMDYPRRELINHVLHHDNLCLLASRQQAAPGFRHVWLADTPANDCVISTTSREGNQVFPLYLYPDSGELISDSPYAQGKNGRRPNLDPAFVRAITQELGLTFVSDGRGDLKKGTFGPEDIFAYAYAIFHSPTYRSRYAEFLKLDFPRLPLTSEKKLFRALAKRGRKLVSLHLMQKSGLWRLITGFSGRGSSVIDSGYPRFTQLVGEQGGRVFINETKYFEGVPRDAWEFQVGGYQVLEKWLRDRRGRTLTFEDTLHYQQIIVAIVETMRVMREIDALIHDWPIV